MQLQKANKDNFWEQLLLIWDALPATALTPMTYSLTLKTRKELGKSGNKNRFLNFGWQVWDLSSNWKYKNHRTGDKLQLLEHIHAFLKKPSCPQQVFPTEKFVLMISTPAHRHFLLFLSNIGLPSDGYLVVLVLQLGVLFSELNKAIPNILAESNLFSCNSYPLSGKFSRWEKRVCFQQREHFFKELLSACWSVTCMPS